MKHKDKLDLAPDGIVPDIAEYFKENLDMEINSGKVHVIA